MTRRMRMLRSCAGFVASCCVVALLSGCVPERSVRVEPADGVELGEPTVTRADAYRVVSGDTLYGIAFKHGMDYRELARMNGIAAPYIIYVGQLLELGPPGQSRPASPPGRSARAQPRPRDSRGSVVGSVIRDTSAPRPESRPPDPKSPVAKAPAAPAPELPAADPVQTARPEPEPTQSTTKPMTTASLPADDAVRWRWPADGKIVGTFAGGDPTRQGINIAGTAGDAVQAAADGVVVYSGSGLIGYGELIIVKHSEGWLSAYGHNRKRLVAEGEGVKAGQRIAEMGRSGASRDMLHFEVRRRGKPIDPLSVLPKRR